MFGSLELDHIVIGAASLQAGTRYVRERLGVDVPVGGTHPLMGTINALMRLAGAGYFEIIAVDPKAPRPGRIRWFALDDAKQKRRLRARPRPIAWVVGTGNIAGVLARANEAGIDLGRAVEITRGDLRWLISVRDDGLLPEGGTLPMVIEWPPGPHPSGRLQDLGIRLRSLRLKHPDPDALETMLRAIGADHLARVEPSDGEEPHIVCELVTPDGRERTL